MFAFKLQSVLDYRKKIEEKILGEYSEKKRELEKEELILKNLMMERESLIDELRKMENKSIHVDDISLYVSYVKQVRENEQKQKKVVEQIKEQLETTVKELLEALKKVKVMEKLKERNIQEYESAARALEQKNSDEMSVLKFGRREK
jgi:flagellar protein FliJ